MSLTDFNFHVIKGIKTTRKMQKVIFRYKKIQTDTKGNLSVIPTGWTISILETVQLPRKIKKFGISEQLSI